VRGSIFHSRFWGNPRLQNYLQQIKSAWRTLAVPHAAVFEIQAIIRSASLYHQSLMSGPKKMYSVVTFPEVSISAKISLRAPPALGAGCPAASPCLHPGVNWRRALELPGQFKSAEI